MRNYKLLILLLLLLVIPAQAGKINNGEDLIRKMHKKYSGKWYKTLTFVQKNTQFTPDGKTQNSVWYEAMSLPGKLRIDFAPMDSNNGMMFVDNKQHNFNKGKLVQSRSTIHPLMVLGFDVYSQPADMTIKQLKDLKFDLSVLRKEKSNGRTIYVVGAKKGDLKSTQFWVDKKNFYLVKTIQPVGSDGKSTQEIQFNKYQKVKGGGWIAPEVLFLVNGKKVFLEEYTDMQFDVELNDELFEPNKWAEVDKTYYKISQVD